MRKAMPGVKCGIARVNDELRPLFPEAVRAIVATASATTEPVVLHVLLYADEGAAPALVEVSWEPAMMTPEPVTAHAAFTPVDGARSCWRLELPLPIDPGSDDAGTLRFGILHSRRANESPRYAELTMSAHDALCCTLFAACPRDAVGVHELDAYWRTVHDELLLGAVLHAADDGARRDALPARLWLYVQLLLFLQPPRAAGATVRLDHFTPGWRLGAKDAAAALEGAIAAAARAPALRESAEERAFWTLGVSGHLIASRAARAHGDRAVLRLPPSAWKEFGPAVWTEEAVAALRARLHHLEAAGRTGDDPFAPYCVSCVNTALAAAIGADTPTTNAATRAYCGKWLRGVGLGGTVGTAQQQHQLCSYRFVRVLPLLEAFADNGGNDVRSGGGLVHIDVALLQREPPRESVRGLLDAELRGRSAATLDVSIASRLHPPPARGTAAAATPPSFYERALGPNPTQTASAAEHRMTEWFQHATALGRVVGHGQTLSERLHAGANRITQKCAALQRAALDVDAVVAAEGAPPPTDAEIAAAAAAADFQGGDYEKYAASGTAAAARKYAASRTAAAEAARELRAAEEARRGTASAELERLRAELAEARAEMTRAAMAAAAAAEQERQARSRPRRSRRPPAACGRCWRVRTSARRASTPFGRTTARWTPLDTTTWRRASTSGCGTRAKSFKTARPPPCRWRRRRGKRSRR